MVSKMLNSLLSVTLLVQFSKADVQSIPASSKINEAYSTSHRVGCVAELSGYLFNLKELSLPINQLDPTQSTMYELEFQDVNGTSSIQFNLCEETARKCPDLLADHANIINSVGTCNHLSKIMIDSSDQKPGTMSLISEKTPGLGVVMSYEGGNMCNDTAHYSLQVQINCNPNLDKTTFSLDKDSLATPCDPKVIMNSPYACPVLSSGPLEKFLDDYNLVIGFPMIAIGSYLCFMGGKYPSTTLFIFSTLAVSLIELFSLFIFVLPNFSPSWTVPVVGIVCLGMGLGMGFGASRWPQVGVVIMGFSLGCLLGFLVYWSFIENSVETTSAKTMTVVGVAAFTAVIYKVLFDYMVIITSAVFGSYILIRGVSMFTGGYVNEFTVVMATNNGDIGDVRTSTFLFWLIMIFLAFQSIKQQLEDRKQHLEAYQYKFHNNAQFETYRTMRDRIEKLGGQGHAYDHYGEGNEQHWRHDPSDSDDDRRPLQNNKEQMY